MNQVRKLSMLLAPFKGLSKAYQDNKSMTDEIFESRTTEMFDERKNQLKELVGIRAQF